MAGESGSGGDGIRVVLIDDHEIILESLIGRLSSEPRITVTGAALTAFDGVALTRSHQPDVVIVDYRSPDLDGVEVAHRLRDIASWMPAHAASPRRRPAPRPGLLYSRPVAGAQRTDMLAREVTERVSH
jgi:CheY-like chemotaxis protein